MFTIVCISDTHTRHGRITVPPGDLLLHAGDCTNSGTLPQLTAFIDWFQALPHPHKILISGNHDFCFQKQIRQARKIVRDVTYLQDESTTVSGLTIYGSPWQPWFLDWAFNLKRGSEIAEKWAMIPEHTDILITHGPPFGILDETHRGEHVGCVDLLERIRDVRPRVHLFGHIHEAAGVQQHGHTLFVNASCPGTGSPVVLELHDDGDIRVCT